jgi:hypothetical protein
MASLIKGIGGLLGFGGTNFGPEVEEQLKNRAIKEEAFSGADVKRGGERGRQLSEEVGRRQAPRIRTQEQNQFRQQQRGLIGQLGERVAGNAPSVAAEQFRAAQESNLRQAASLAASQRGTGNAALQSRGLGQAVSAANLGAAGQAAQLRAAEQQAAEQTLGGLLQGARGQDIGLATSQQQLGLQAEQIRGQLQAQFEAQGLSADQAALQAQIALEQLLVQQRAGEQSADAARSAAAATALGGLAQGAGAAIGAA